MDEHEQDLRILALPQLDVSDLYLDLVIARARATQHTLGHWPAAVALAQAGECLEETVAHLRDAADRLTPDDDEWRARLESLAVGLLAEAAAFEHAADVLVSRERAA